MLNLKSIHGHHKIIPTLLVALTSINFIEAVDTNNGTTQSCIPLNCVAACTPNCNIDQVCILRTMTDCAICPASSCMSRTALGLPSLATNSTAPDQSEFSSGNGGMIGGIVGGLVGLGVIVGICVYCYIKREKKKGKLPFAFTNGAGNPSHIMSQEKFMSPPPTPNPSIIAALSQQRSRDSVAQQQQPSRYIGLAELASPTTERSILSSPTTPTSTIASIQQRRSILSPNNNSIPSRFNSINTPLYNINSTTNNDNIYNNDNNTYNNDNQTVTTPTSTIITTTPTATAPSNNAIIPEEFEERIALQNKRISQILNSNPRLSSQHRGSFSQQPPLPPQQQQNYDMNRNSYMSYTTDDDSEFDDDRNSMASSTGPQVARQQYQPQLATQAVQVTRVKAQIMRVNSVRTSTVTPSSSGLSRSESVRTVLTAVTPPIPEQPQQDDEEEELAIQFPSTPNNHSFATLEDPFLDTNTSSKSITSDEYWGHK